MTTFVRSFALLSLVSAPLLAQRTPPPVRPPAGTQQPPTRGDTGAIRNTPTGYVLDFQDQDLRVVMSAMAEAGNLNVTFTNLPTKRVTLRMARAVSRDEMINALEGLAESNQLRFIRNGEFIRIEGPVVLTAQQQIQQQQQQQAALAAQNQLRLYTYRLKHVSATTVAPVLMNLIIGTGIQRAGVQQTFQITPGGAQVITLPGGVAPQQNQGGRGGNAGGQQYALRPQCSGKGAGARLPRVHAADARHPLGR